MIFPKPSPKCGQRLILHRLDEIVASQPERPMFQIPRSTHPSDGFRIITSKLLANAVNRAAWWLKASLGHCDTFETIGYIGPSMQSIPFRIQV